MANFPISKRDDQENRKGWTRKAIDICVVDSFDTTSTQFSVKYNFFPAQMELEGYWIQFITGELAGHWVRITGFSIRQVQVEPDLGIVPADSDIFSIYDIDRNKTQEIEEALTEDSIEVLADNIDISPSVEFVSTNVNKWRNSSLYINTAGQIDITLEFAPEAGDYYEPDDSPLIFSAAGSNIYEINFIWKAIRLTGSNANLVTAKLKGLV